MAEFTKRCPSCNAEQEYGSKKVYFRALKGQWECRKCATKKNAASRDISWMSSDDYRSKMSNSIKQVRTGNSYGESFKRKCRENKLYQISKCGTQRTFNIVACKFMDDFSLKFGINLRHGLNGGERQFIGYSLDGYDPVKNVIFEYDEPKHHVLSVKKRDEERQKRLIEHLNPTAFWRYDEKTNVLVDVINKEIICQPQ